MKTAAITILVALSASAALAKDPAAFGFIERVVLEPNAEAPERVQLWGVFSVATREEGVYQVPEDGYLYFKLPASGADQARAEWRTLAQRPKGAEPRIVAISIRTEGLRVREGNENFSSPDTYSPGHAWDRLGEGARLLRAIPKGGERHYAVVDRVEAEPSAKAPKEIRIWGTFAMNGKPPRSGYIDFEVDQPPKWAQTIDEWKATAGSGRAVAFYTRGPGSLEVRAADEAPGAPDSAMVLNLVLPVRSDTRYPPIRRLLGSKCYFAECY